MHPNVDETPYPKEQLRSYMVVFDTVYNPENTLLVKEARAVGENAHTLRIPNDFEIGPLAFINAAQFTARIRLEVVPQLGP
jgi:hypothetical protein